MNKLFTTYTASEAKNKFGEMLIDAYRSPVAITKRGRPTAYMIATADMEAFEDFISPVGRSLFLKRMSLLVQKKRRISKIFAQ